MAVKSFFHSGFSAVLLAFLFLGFAACSTSRGLSGEGGRYDVLIRNARVLDGTGNPWFRADVAVRGDRIAAVGDLKGAEAVRVIDAGGLYLAPGFTDVHSHAGEGLVAKDRSDGRPLLAQGVTTVFINPDGGGPSDLARQREDLLKDGLGINAAQMVPHGSVREAVMGMADRLATEEELEAMRKLVRQGMEEGAFGLSSGPFYAPGSYSDTRELVELSKVAGEYGGAYSSHIRDESNYTIGVVAAVDEVIRIAREADLPAVVTHIKVLGPPVWGFSQGIVQRIGQARKEGLQVYADQYPYTASATGLGPALLPRWAEAGGDEALLLRLNHPDTLIRIKTAMQENLARRGGADRIQFRTFRPDTTVEGRTLEQVAKDWGVSPVDAAVSMLKRGSAGIVSFNMLDSDVHTFMTQPWMMTSSDGSYPVWGRGVPHPRAFGSFPRKIRKYVLEDGVVGLEDAVRSMTSLPAQVFRIPDRGMIRPGAFADIVVFDLDRIADKATFSEPFQLSEGMVHVLVNGQIAILEGKFTGAMAGRVLDRRGAGKNRE